MSIRLAKIFTKNRCIDGEYLFDKMFVKNFARKIRVEHIFTFNNRVGNNHRAVAIQNTNRRVHVSERNFYLVDTFSKPDFFSASLLRDVHAVAHLRYNFRALFRYVLRN